MSKSIACVLAGATTVYSRTLGTYVTVGYQGGVLGWITADGTWAAGSPPP